MFLLPRLILFIGTISTQNLITITLTPRDYVDPRLEDNFVCGVSPSIDNGRLIAELNSDFIFAFLDKGVQSNPYYQTQVFDAVIFTTNGNPKKLIRKWLDEEKGPGLYSLLVLPTKRQCNSEVFNDAKEAAYGYYPAFITSKIDELELGIKRFLDEAESMKGSYGGFLPKLCGIKVAMENETALSREHTLISLFNFLFNENQRILESKGWKRCKTAQETTDAFLKSHFFYTEFEPSFKQETERVSESAGSALSTILKETAIDKKAICFVETEFSQGRGNSNPASDEDIVRYNGPIVFKENSKTSQLFVDIKKDNITEEDETFLLHLKTMNDLKSNRKKRSYFGQTKRVVVWGEPTFHCDENTPCLHDHQKCHDGKCVECVGSEDCVDPSVCNTKVNICTKCFEGEGCPEYDNAKCEENNLEITMGDKCIPCERHGDCRLNIAMKDLNACIQGKCVECTKDEHCEYINRNHGCNTDENKCTSIRPITKVLELKTKSDEQMHTRMQWLRKYASECYSHSTGIMWNDYTNAEVGYVAYDNSNMPMNNYQFDEQYRPGKDLEGRCKKYTANVKDDKSKQMHAERQLLRKATEAIKADPEPAIDTIYIFSWMSPCNTCKKETMKFAYETHLGKKLNVAWSVWYEKEDPNMKSWCAHVQTKKEMFQTSPVIGGVTLNYYPLKKALYKDFDIPPEC